jgi:hypothetical protein
VGELSLGERFCRPPAFANGGYARGAMADLLSGEEEGPMCQALAPEGRSRGR